MNVSVEQLGACKKLLRVEVDAAEVDEAFKSVTAEFLKHAELPGFRPGKAPRAVVEKTFSGRIEKEVKSKLLSETYRKAITQEKIRVVGSPDVEETQFGRGQAFIFTVTLEAEPDFELPEYKGLPAKRENRVVTSEDVERAIGSLREQRAQYKDAERAAEAGDFAVVDYSGTSEGKPIVELAPAFKGLSEHKNYWIQLTPSDFVPGFGEQLIGALPGETRAVKVTFPAEFVAPELAGKTAEYQVTINAVKIKLTPALDDAFAQSLGAKNLEELNTGVRRDLENELKYKLSQSVRTQLASGLTSRLDFELPEVLVKSETRSVVYEIVRANQERGIAREDIDSNKDKIYEAAAKTARERVKLDLVVVRIADKEGIKAAQEEVLSQVERMAKQSNTRADKLLKQLDERGGLNEIAMQILRNKVLDFLQLHAKIEEVSPSAPPTEQTPAT